MARSPTALAALALLALLCMASGSEFSHPSVVTLTSDNYDDMVSDGKVYFIKFYAPWCGHCKKLAPTWGELGAALAGNDKVAIAHVDCTVSRDVCSANDIKGYPSLKAVHMGEDYKPYKGARSLEALKSFIEEAAVELKTEA